MIALALVSTTERRPIDARRPCVAEWPRTERSRKSIHDEFRAFPNEPRLA
jgi:hypothetical protein